MNPDVRMTASSTAPDGPHLLTVNGVTKSFGGVVALLRASLTLDLGQVLGVVGENGAGKSTLMKVLAGVYPAGTYEGRFELGGEECRFRSVRDSRAAGVILIPQELHVAPDLTIAENMFAGALPRRGPVVDAEALVAKAREWLGFFDLDVDPLARGSVLSPSEQRLVLIAGALSRDARVLILDEPTASLSEGETHALFAHVARLRERDVGVLFISHRLDDIAQVCDDLLVMRNGECVDYFESARAPRKDIVAAMIGRDPSHLEGPAQRQIGDEVALEIDGLTLYDPVDRARERASSVQLHVRRGEVLGLFGLVGAGRTELAKSLLGSWPGRVEGSVTLYGKTFRPGSPAAAIAMGVALLTEDRKQTGIFPGHSLVSNLSAASPRPVSRWGFLQSYSEAARARGLMQTLDVRARSEYQPIETLSGGNQQKVLLGRWLAITPKLLILDEPTVGIDVGAREEIYNRIEALADEGCAVLLISSDLDEVRRMCNRTHVMYKGRITAALPESPSRHDLMAAATGGEQ